MQLCMQYTYKDIWTCTIAIYAFILSGVLPELILRTLYIEAIYTDKPAHLILSSTVHICMIVQT